MCGSTLDAIAMVDASSAGFAVYVKVLEVVVEVDVASTKVATQKGSMSGENSSHINVSLAALRRGRELCRVG